MFQNIGAGAYKEGLSNTHALDERTGHPHRSFRTIHVAGTNGKGSTAHTLAAILQSAGYRTGLYTSPHLLDFRERIRVNGEPISEDYVVRFTEENRLFFEPLYPSFFELATAMAFKYFEDEKVDVAVIEVGLGGRLDCTNIISPDLCVITNIGMDHVNLLGDTLAKIAHEKAGIIKPGVPVIIGEDCAETRPVFQEKADACGAPIRFASDRILVSDPTWNADGSVTWSTKDYPNLKCALSGYCQEKNTNTILYAVKELKKLGYTLPAKAVRSGFADVCSLTGLMGRWQTVAENPRIVCDTGHNSHGIRHIVRQLEAYLAGPDAGTLRIVFGMVSDKDITEVLKMLPKSAVYYFTQASVKRAMPMEKLQQMAREAGLDGAAYASVSEAVHKAKADASPSDLIYVGGSTFIVADLLQMGLF